MILLALFEIREERSDRWRHAPERPIEVELSDVASATHILEVGERGKRRFAVRTLVDRPKLVPSERILREDVDVVRLDILSALKGTEIPYRAVRPAFSGLSDGLLDGFLLLT